MCCIQAAACADAGASLISPFVGRIMDWYKKKEGREFASHEVCTCGLCTPQFIACKLHTASISKLR